MLTIAVLIVFCFCMVWAAYSDLTRFTLSNKLCLTVTLLYPLYLFGLYLNGNALPLGDIGMTVGVALIIFIVCAGFFTLNIMGGGDVKLIPAVALWAGTTHLLTYLLIISLVGGLVAAIILVIQRINASNYSKSSVNINLSVSEKKDSAVPYGVGIAVGGLYVAYQLFLALNQSVH